MVQSDGKRILVLFTDAGGGHRSTATALDTILSAAGHRVERINPYLEILHRLDLFARYSSRSVEETYNEVILAKGRTRLSCLAFYAGATANVRLLTPWGRRALAALWDRTHPDMVISVMPMINGMVADSLARHRGGAVPFAVVLTDWAELARHVWFPPGKHYAAIVGTDIGAQRLERKRHPKDLSIALDSLILRPEFAAPLPAGIGALRQEFGLQPHLPTVVFSYGGVGAPRMRDLATTAARLPEPFQAIFLCGRNTALERELRGMNLAYPHAVLGFTDRVRDVLSCADVFVGKAGPQSVSEAIAMGLPILLDGHKVLPQERTLLKLAQREGLGVTFTSDAEFLSSLQTQLTADSSPEERERRRRFAAPTQVVAAIEKLFKVCRL